MLTASTISRLSYRRHGHRRLFHAAGRGRNRNSWREKPKEVRRTPIDYDGNLDGNSISFGELNIGSSGNRVPKRVLSLYDGAQKNTLRSVRPSAARMVRQALGKTPFLALRRSSSAHCRDGADLLATQCMFPSRPAGETFLVKKLTGGAVVPTDTANFPPIRAAWRRWCWRCLIWMKW